MSGVVEVAGLTHDYGEVVALRDLDLSIPAGITGLVGANGAGKISKQDGLKFSPNPQQLEMNLKGIFIKT